MAGRSIKGPFGEYNHYDENGHRTGKSVPNFWGGYTNYDENGNKIGTSDPNIFGGYTERDKNGNKIGRSDPNLMGGYTHRDNNGNQVGRSNPGAFGSYRNTNSTQGCYIATCVYGSYDCPEVWTLRRFRDYTLAENPLGRLFIKSYYAISPWLVKKFGKQDWFRKSWKRFLDRLVGRLQGYGVEDTPYSDREY